MKISGIKQKIANQKYAKISERNWKFLQCGMFLWENFGGVYYDFNSLSL